VLVANANGVEITDVAAAQLDSARGDGSIARVVGALSGDHRDGSLEVADVGSAKLTLQRTRSSLDRVAGEIVLELRDGECVVTGPAGSVEIDQLRAEVAVRDARGPVRISGTDGEVRLTGPQAESTVDVRRAEVDVRLSTAVPLTILTTDGTLRLVLDGPPAVAIDAVASQGRVVADDFDLDADTTEQESRLAHTFGETTAPRVSLRNSHGDILIEIFSAAIVNPSDK
jgi:hypothetical protein